MTIRELEQGLTEKEGLEQGFTENGIHRAASRIALAVLNEYTVTKPFDSRFDSPFGRLAVQFGRFAVRFRSIPCDSPFDSDDSPFDSFDSVRLAVQFGRLAVQFGRLAVRLRLRRQLVMRALAGFSPPRPEALKRLLRAALTTS